jgi:hypothetical protein
MSSIIERAPAFALGLALYLAPSLALGMPCPDAPAEQCACAHGPVALPGLGGAPEWFDVDGDGFFRPELHDPRWSGAPLRVLPFSDQAALTDAAQTRVLAHGDHLYLSFQVLTDDTGPNASDAIYLGITQGSASQAYAVRVRFGGDGSGGVAPVDPDPSDDEVPPQDNPLPEPLDVSFANHWVSDVAGSFAASPVTSGLPAWIDQVAVWKPPPGSTAPWAITMRVDKTNTASGLNPSPGSIRLFLGVDIRLAAGVVPFANVNPASAGVAGTIIPTSTADWARYAELGTACTAGVTLNRMDVGVYPGVPGTDSTGTLTNRLCASDPCPAATPGGNPENVFRAIARNVDHSAGIGNWALRARFRYADWGSTVANRKYGPWKDIATTPAGTAILTGPAGPLTATNGWYWHTPADDGSGSSTSNVVIDFQCDKGTGAYCPTLTNPANMHQCVLVELGQPAASSFEFVNTAVYRNMDFHGLSTLDRPATISIRGLKEVTGVDADRDVYLYVETVNMPAFQEEPLWLPTEQMAAAARLARDPIPVPRPRSDKTLKASARARARLKKDALAELAAQEKLMVERAARLATSGRKLGNVPVSSTLAMSPEQIVETVWPTYRIRPYYDTGRTRTIGDETVRVLAPMVPFGFHLSHEGPFFGFTHALEAADPGVTLEPISERWFKVRIPSEGAVKVRTKITAEEKPLPLGEATPKPCPDPTPCPACPKPDHGAHCHCKVGAAGGDPSPAILGGLLLALGLALRRRRGRGSYPVVRSPPARP